MRSVLIIAAMSAAATIAAYASLPNTARLELTTWSGEVYVIGEGDTCNAAWTNHGPIADDWRSLDCIND